MILSKKDRTIVANLIEEKFGPEAVKIVEVKDYAKLKEYFDSLEGNEKEIEYGKIESVSDILDMVDGKTNEIARDKVCSKCGKEEVFFGGKDMFYIIKHNVCEKCYHRYK